MKRLGLLGGMSWHSTAEYYRIINEEIASRLGGSHSADLLMHSFDFQEIEDLQHAHDWDEAGRRLADAAANLEAAGAEGLMICTNAMHRVAAAVTGATSAPLVHMVDALVAAMEADGHRAVGVLGARSTMEGEFYVGRMDELGLEVLVPPEEDRALIDAVIFAELVRGSFTPESRAEFVRIIEGLAERGATAVVLGCTEIPLLVGPDDTDVPLYDSARVHALAGADWMLAP